MTQPPPDAEIRAAVLADRRPDASSRAEVARSWRSVFERYGYPA
jgi:hypothetical protein